jgi:SOS-response transcriptional repressor LexA
MNIFDKEQFRNLLIKAKGSRGINQLAREAGVSSSLLSYLINLKRENPPSISILIKIATVAQNNIGLEDLMVASGYIAPTSEYISKYCDNVEDATKSLYAKATNTKVSESYECLYPDQNVMDDAKVLPLLKEISSDYYKTFNKKNTVKYYFDNKLDFRVGSYFCYLAPDNSMIHSRIKKGDLLTIKFQSEIEDNKIFIILLHNTLTLRKVFIKSNCILLTAEDNKTEPIIFERDDMEKEFIEILGMVVNARLKF